MSINLDEMKAKLNEQLEQEAKESGRLPNQGETSGTDPAEDINSKDETTKADPDINIEDILNNAPEDEKGNKIIPDEIFNRYYRLLPAKCINVSGNYRSSGTGGKLKILGANPAEDIEIQKKGGETLQATLKQRRTMAEDITLMLAQKANPKAIQELGLQADANNQQAVITAAILQAISGNVKAQQFLRDTIGEQPTAKQDVSVTMTDDDKALLDQVQKRLGITD